MRAGRHLQDRIRPQSCGTSVEDSARKATVTYDGVTNKATLDPSANLQRGQKYRVKVTTGAKDEAGNRLDQDEDPSNGYQKMVWRFTVRN